MTRNLARFVIACASTLCALSQTIPNAVPPPAAVVQFLDANGKPLAGGKLYTYAAGTTTPQLTYTNAGAGTPNANPVVLDSSGRAQIWIGPNAYKFVLQDANSIVQWTEDNLVDTTLNFVNYVKTAGTSTLITYLPPGTGAVQTTVAMKLAQTLNVIDFGAACNDSIATPGTNDTAAIQAALNNTAALNANGISRVLLPAGMCRVTAPLVVTRFVTLKGKGFASVIHCDYANWVGTDYTCLKLQNSGTSGANVPNSANRVLGDFSLYGTGNGGILTTAMSVGMDPSLAPIALLQVVNYSIFGNLIENIHISNFDTGILTTECFQSTFSNIQMDFIRQSHQVIGRSINVINSHWYVANAYNHTTAVSAGITPFTSSTGSTVGIFMDAIEPGSGPFAGRYLDAMSNPVEGRPEGIETHDSLVDTFDRNVLIYRVLYAQLTRNAFDGSTGWAIELNPLNYDNVLIKDNYIASFNNSDGGILVDDNSTLTPQFNLIIEDNWINQGNNAGLGTGIHFATGSITVPQVAATIEGNRITGFLNAMKFDLGLLFSSVRNNKGLNNTGTFCIWGSTNGDNSTFEGNVSADSFDILSVPSGPIAGFTIANNHSVTQNTSAVFWWGVQFTPDALTGRVMTDLDSVGNGGWRDATWITFGSGVGSKAVAAVGTLSGGTLTITSGLTTLSECKVNIIVSGTPTEYLGESAINTPGAGQFKVWSSNAASTAQFQWKCTGTP